MVINYFGGRGSWPLNSHNLILSLPICNSQVEGIFCLGAMDLFRMKAMLWKFKIILAAALLSFLKVKYCYYVLLGEVGNEAIVN